MSLAVAERLVATVTAQIERETQQPTEWVQIST
jgi:hypothetical protein